MFRKIMALVGSTGGGRGWKGGRGWRGFLVEMKKITDCGDDGDGESGVGHCSAGCS